MHYTKYELDQYRNRTMGPFRRLFCRIHLLRCHRCRERLTHLKLDDILVLALRKSEQMLKIPENPLEYRKLCDIFHESKTRRNSTA